MEHTLTNKQAPDQILDLPAMELDGQHAIEQQHYTQAGQIYETIITTMIADAARSFQRYEDLQQTFTRCVTALQHCLQAIRQPGPLRWQLLQLLFTMYRYDLDLGSTGLADDIPEILLSQTTVPEQQKIAKWLRQYLTELHHYPALQQIWNNHLRLQLVGGFLLEMEKERLSDEQYLHICKESKRCFDEAAWYLSHQRLQEASTLARHVDSVTLLALTERFTQQHQEKTIVQIMSERARNTADTRILDWMRDYYRKNGQYAEALLYALPAFYRRPSLARFRELRQLARKIGRWEALRAELLHDLQIMGECTILILIALNEKQIDRALALLKEPEACNGFVTYEGRGLIILTVARAAQSTRPEAARQLYEQYVEHLIAERGRDNYREACRYLKLIYTLYEQMRARNQWDSYISALLQQHRRLRALRDELQKAHLLNIP